MEMDAISGWKGIPRRRAAACALACLLPCLATAGYTNPVIPRGPDPYCRRASDGKYYLVTTSLDFHSSENLVDWKRHGRLKIQDAIGAHDFWAPEFVEYRNRFYLFYCARKQPGGPHFLGVAVADRPEGPYRSKPEPLTEIHPSIDPHVFFDEDGRIYLYWSEKGIGVDHRAINGCELAPDLMGLKGEPRMLIYSTQAWEYGKKWQDKGWNEGPVMLKRNGTYYLMYSANLYASPYYGVGFATAASPLGRFEKWKDNPVLSREGHENTISGPGHHSVVASPDGKELFAVYHKHIAPGETERHVCIDRMGFRPDGSIYVNGPTLTPQPLPSGADGLCNVAAKARVRISSGEAQSAAYLVDGEIAIIERFGGREWSPAARDAEPVVRLEWDKPAIVSEVYLYDSATPGRKIRKASVRLSDGTTFEEIDFPEGPGAAASLRFAPRAVAWMAIRIDQAEGGTPPALSEIMVRGRPL